MQSLKGRVVLSGGASVAGTALGAIISKVGDMPVCSFHSSFLSVRSTRAQKVLNR